MAQNNMEVVDRAVGACRASDLTDEGWMEAFDFVYTTHTSAQAEIERLTKERDALREALNHVGLDAEQKKWVVDFVNNRTGKEND